MVSHRSSRALSLFLLCSTLFFVTACVEDKPVYNDTNAEDDRDTGASTDQGQPDQGQPDQGQPDLSVDQGTPDTDPQPDQGPDDLPPEDMPDLTPDTGNDLSDDTREEDIEEDAPEDILDDIDDQGDIQEDLASPDVIEDVQDISDIEPEPDLPPDMPDEPDMDPIPDVVEDIVQDVVEDIEDEAVEDMVEDTTPDLVEDAQEDIPEDTAPDMPEDVQEDIPDMNEVAAGLDQRPSNPTCVAPAPPPVGDIDINLRRVFSNLSFTLPVGLYQAPGDNSAWYVIEKRGIITRFNNQEDVNTASTFLDIDARVRGGTSNNDERGLLGMAFHPNYANNGEIYVSYTSTTNGGNGSRISRFTRQDGGQAIDTGSEEIILEFSQPASNHNGGDLKFGPDGMLYISFGDGGGGGDPFNHGQNRDSLFGAILRIDVDQNRDQNPPYAIPQDNPFAQGGGAPEIFAWGLRNVWRFTFDPDTGDLWASDVGQNAQEEVNLIRLGGNYGWPIREGDLCYNNNPNCGPNDGLLPPVVTYPHSEGRSITGGHVYRGDSIPALAGSYIYGDYVTGRLWGVAYDEDGEAFGQLLQDTNLFLASFGQDQNGEVFILAYDGTIYALEADSDPVPDTFPRLLSQTGCVQPDNPSEPVAGMVPYEVQVPFWSDGARKERFFAIPDGTTIELDAQGDFLFPPGTVTMKNFYLADRLFETRLFMRHDDGRWAGYTYEWNEDGQDAQLLDAGKVAPVEGQDWIFPSRPQCLSCHTEAAGRTLGLELLQLRHPITYPRTGRTADQIETLVSVGMLNAPTGDLTTLQVMPQISDQQADLDSRVRAYLHTNCASCHVPGGPARGDLDLSWWAQDFAASLCNVPPLLNDLGITDARIVAQSDPERSILWQRVARRDSNAMPPLGSNVLDQEGLDLLQEWIESDTCAGFVPPESVCDDGVDNDGDDLTDCEDENCLGTPACGALSCGNPGDIEDLPATITGNTTGYPSTTSGTCAGAGTENIYALTGPGTYCADTIGSSYDTALHVRTDCTDVNTELACNDDIRSGFLQSRVQFTLDEQETAFIFIDGYDGAGAFTLTVTEGTCP